MCTKCEPVVPSAARSLCQCSSCLCCLAVLHGSALLAAIKCGSRRCMPHLIPTACCPTAAPPLPQTPGLQCQWNNPERRLWRARRGDAVPPAPRHQVSDPFLHGAVVCGGLGAWSQGGCGHATLAPQLRMPRLHRGGPGMPAAHTLLPCPAGCFNCWTLPTNA